MANYTGGMAVCPFYQRESRLSIICEGYCEDQQVGMKFRTEEEKRAWQREYCLRFYYPRCPLAATVLAHYRGQEPQKPAPRTSGLNLRS